MQAKMVGWFLLNIAANAPAGMCRTALTKPVNFYKPVRWLAYTSLLAGVNH